MEYLEDLKKAVRENISEAEIMGACEAGNLAGIRVVHRAENPDLVDVYETYFVDTVFGQSKPEEQLVYEQLNRITAAYYVEDDLTIDHCLTLLDLYTDPIIPM